MFDRSRNELYIEEMPRAALWYSFRGNVKIDEKRKTLDDLPAGFVHWTPYAFLNF